MGKAKMLKILGLIKRVMIKKQLSILIRDCRQNELVRDFVTLHVFFDLEHIPEHLPTHEQILKQVSSQSTIKFIEVGRCMLLFKTVFGQKPVVNSSY